MIEVRTPSGARASRKPRASKASFGAAAGDLVRGLESLYERVPDLGTLVVGRRAKSLVRRLPSESPLGPDRDSYPEPDCGA